jgi:glutathione S-transferase
MKLYSMTGSCSLASAIALREAGIAFETVKVDKRTRRADGRDFLEINPKGYVPALQLDSGDVLTENVVVLQYIADLKPDAHLAPPAGSLPRWHMQEWLSFVNSELHKNYSPLFSPEAGEEVKQYARNNLHKRLTYLQSELASRPYLMGEQFTVADIYLFVVLGWSGHVNVDLAKYPALGEFRERVGARPHVKESLAADSVRPKASAG